jgi:hypothetical protein
LILLAFGAAHAASTCYDDKDYPAIGGLAPTPSGYRIVLSGAERRGSDTAPVLEFSSGRWQLAGRVPCKFGRCVKETQGCSIRTPDDMDLNEDIEQTLLNKGVEEIDQKVSACVESGGYVYFGIGFYWGEGTRGVGGIGRWDKKTGKVDVRRPQQLQETGVTHLAHDGKYLWIGTGNQHECMGMVPTEGLLRYDWDKDHLDRADPSGQGLCGFMVRGLLVRDHTLVVATDMGLSLGSGVGLENPIRWRHLVPDLQAPGFMRETTCDALYNHLLRTVSRQDDGMGWSSFSQLSDTLKMRNPKLLEQYIGSGAK